MYVVFVSSFFFFFSIFFFCISRWTGEKSNAYILLTKVSHLCRVSFCLVRKKKKRVVGCEFRFLFWFLILVFRCWVLVVAPSCVLVLRRIDSEIYVYVCVFFVFAFSSRKNPSRVFCFYCARSGVVASRSVQKKWLVHQNVVPKT